MFDSIHQTRTDIAGEQRLSCFQPELEYCLLLLSEIAKSKIIHMICEDTNIITVKFIPCKEEELEKTAMLTKVQMFITQFDSD